VPLTYRIDPTQRVVWARAWGVFTDGELVAHSRHLRADPRFQPDFRQLVVGTEIGDLQATRQGLTLLARLNPFGAGARRAWVVSTDVSFGLARMYDLMRGESGDTLEIFRDQPAALEWLGLPATWEPPAASPDDPVFSSADPAPGP
jgi:hypothetical protein